MWRLNVNFGDILLNLFLGSPFRKRAREPEPDIVMGYPKTKNKEGMLIWNIVSTSSWPSY